MFPGPSCGGAPYGGRVPQPDRDRSSATDRKTSSTALGVYRAWVRSVRLIWWAVSGAVVVSCVVAALTVDDWVLRGTFGVVALAVLVALARDAVRTARRRRATRRAGPPHRK